MKRIVIDEEKCDGCGLCVTGCHEGALAIVEGKARLVHENFCDGLGSCIGECPQGAISFVLVGDQAEGRDNTPSLFQHAPQRRNHQWPVQFNLVPVGAPFLENADLLICADCVPFAMPGFYQTLLTGKAVLVGCPKFDNVNAYLEKLTRIFQERPIRSVTLARMEVPCCSGLARLAQIALNTVSKKIPYTEVTVGIDGTILATQSPLSSVALP
ncbi:MAG: 4Fe-4S binding protein [Spirochaetales bacterium]|nr:4Fe-4S binding protein [Spirochaetales bacterium]